MRFASNNRASKTSPGAPSSCAAPGTTMTSADVRKDGFFAEFHVTKSA